jgi:hypothetical protein
MRTAFVRGAWELRDAMQAAAVAAAVAAAAVGNVK